MSLESLYNTRAFVFDIETESDSHTQSDNLRYNTRRPFCIAFKWITDGIVHKEVMTWDQLKNDCIDFRLDSIMRDRNVLKIGNHIGFDAEVYEQFTKTKVNGLLDNIIMAKYIDENDRKYDLASLVKKYMPETKILHPYPEYTLVEPVMISSGQVKKEFDKDELGKRLKTYKLVDVLKVDELATKLKQEVADAEREQELLRHCSEDVDLEFDLARTLKPQVVKLGVFDWIKNVEMRVVEVFVTSQLRGMPWNKEKLQKVYDEFTSKMETATKEMCALTCNPSFNPESWMQVSRALYKNITPRCFTDGSKKKTDPLGSVDKEEIKHWAEQGIPLAKLMQEFNRYKGARKCLTSKEKNGLIDNCVNGVVHTEINTCGTVTNRFTSKNPPLQNIPARDKELAMKIRSCSEGLWLVYDFSQIEPRLLGHFADCPQLKEAYSTYDEEGKVIGVYGPIMQAKGWDKATAKTFYLANTYSLADELYDMLPACKRFKESIVGDWNWALNYYGNMSRTGKNILGSAYTLGYTTSIAGGRRHVPEIRKWLAAGSNVAKIKKNGDKQRGYSLAAADERECFNAIFQRSCSDVIKLRIVKLSETKEYQDERFYIPMSIHDEIDMLCLDDTLYKSEVFDAKVKTILETNYENLRIPLAVEGGFGENWSEAK